MRITSAFLEGLCETPQDVETIAISDKRIEYCAGCFRCMKNGGECIYDGDNSGYKNRNITIEGGGTIDGRGADETERYNTLLRMGHGENVVIRGITFKNAVRYNAMEITACRNVTVDACKFEGIYAHNDCECKDKPNHSVVNAHEFIQIEELDEGGSGGMTKTEKITIVV